MSEIMPNYDPRYLAGVMLFNRGDFFEAHEAWEQLWMESSNPERKFYQGLIQAAVGLCHFANGNVNGAVKLYHSARAYMDGCGSPFLGLDVDRFWSQMAACFRELLASPAPPRAARPDPDALPVLELRPAPAAW